MISADLITGKLKVNWQSVGELQPFRMVFYRKFIVIFILFGFLFLAASSTTQAPETTPKSSGVSISSSFMCPGSLGEGSGKMSCSPPLWTIGRYLHEIRFPNWIPQFYYKLEHEQGIVRVADCEPGTCFMFSYQKCVPPQLWSRECQISRMCVGTNISQDGSFVCVGTTDPLLCFDIKLFPNLFCPPDSKCLSAIVEDYEVFLSCEDDKVNLGTTTTPYPM